MLIFCGDGGWARWRYQFGSMSLAPTTRCWICFFSFRHFYGRAAGDYLLVLRLLVLQPFSPTASSPTSSSPTHFSFFHSTVLQPNSPTPTGPTSCYFTILISRIYKSCVHMYTTSKPIELESPGCTGFEANSQNFKAWAIGTFKLNSFRTCVYNSVNKTTFFLLTVRTEGGNFRPFYFTGCKKTCKILKRTGNENAHDLLAQLARPTKTDRFIENCNFFKI